MPLGAGIELRHLRYFLAVYVIRETAREVYALGPEAA